MESIQLHIFLYTILYIEMKQLALQVKLQEYKNAFKWIDRYMYVRYIKKDNIQNNMYMTYKVQKH